MTPRIKRFFTEAEAAEYLAISARHLRRLRVAEEGPAFVRTKGRITYGKRDLDIWAKARTVKPKRAK